MTTIQAGRARRGPRYRVGRLLCALSTVVLSAAAWRAWLGWWADDAQAPTAAGWSYAGAGLTLAAAVVVGSARLGVLLPVVVATVVVCAAAAWTLEGTGGPFWMVGVLNVGVVAAVVTGLAGALVVLLRARADVRGEAGGAPRERE